MWHFITNLFNTSDWPARWNCGDWSTGHGYLHIVSDFAIFGAYLTIPILIIILGARHRRMLTHPVAWLFVFFILCCGLTHFIEGTLFFKPWYRLSGLFKLLTAVISWPTVVSLLWLVPRGLQLPEENRRLANLNDSLEERIRERTAELREVNQSLEDKIARLEKAEQELKKHSSELQRINADLLLKNQENEMFVYSVSHDLRSPLVNLQGFSNELILSSKELKTVLDQAELSEEVQKETSQIIDGDMIECTEFIQQGVSRVSSIIDALLQLSRVGRYDYQWRMNPLNSIIQEILSSITLSLEEKGAFVNIEQLPDVWGDTTALQQLFANLIENAIKYLDPQRGGLIEILHTGGEGPLSVIAVKDNGIGIPEISQTEIFRAFQRSHPEHTSGEGLGLTIVRRIVERHGGKIWLESRPGQGTTFFVTLPVAGSDHG